MTRDERRIRQEAAAAREALEALAAAGERCASLTEPCPRCDGTGLEPPCDLRGDACALCGGIAEICNIAAELHALRTAIERARATGARTPERSEG